MKKIKILLAVTIMLCASSCSKGTDMPPELISEDIASDVTDSSDSPVDDALPASLEGAISDREAYAMIGDDLPISRGLAAKMLALAFTDKNSIDCLEREINFTDTSPDFWYDRYINACVISGLMLGLGDTFSPEEPLSVSHAQALLDRIDGNNTIHMQITDENKDKPISYALWTDMYVKLLENMSGDKTVYESNGLKQENLIVLAASKNNAKLPDGHIITDKGAASCSGFSVDAYIDKSVTVLTKDSEIVAVLDIYSETPTIKNAYIVWSAGVGITIFAGGAQRTYSYSDPPEKLVSGTVCDLKISSGTALSVTTYSESITGVIKRVTAEFVELEERGKVKLSSQAAFYAENGDAVTLRELTSLIVGTDIAKFVCSNGEILAAVITKNTKPEKIRVALSTTGFNGYVHNSVELTSDTAFTVTGPELIAKSYKAGEVFEVSNAQNSNLFGKERIYVKPENGGKIQILSTERNWPGKEKPSYRGVIEIAAEENGYSIVNELSMEEYLYAVIPSEMPTSHGVDAAKVQAVTARSFTYNQYYANRFMRYGAHVDDSVSCQVYNNVPENSTSVKAVDETAGLCLTYGGEVISANFFSTSCGMTANSGEVWASSQKQFPTSSPEYLTAVKQFTDGGYNDLSVEENAAAFLKDTSVKAYDSGFSWFRWNVEMAASEIGKSINQNIAARYNIAPQFIKTLQPDGLFKSRPIETIGELLDIEILKRGEAGNILTIKITGSSAVVTVSTEYNIRLLLKPSGENVVINRADKTTVTNYSIMPSAFFVIDKTYEDNALKSVKFFGGGNGHGVGMSQNGVKGMLEKGHSVESVLLHYYKGSIIEKMY